MAKSRNVLVVGGGITASIAAHQLSRSSSLRVTLWDKARACGGRMATYKSRSNLFSPVDLGAQYLTPPADLNDQLRPFYEELKSADLIAPLSKKIRGMKKKYPENAAADYVAPKGMSSIVEHFINDLGEHSEINYEKRLIELKKRNGAWLAINDKEESREFDAVLLTFPTPQLNDVRFPSDLIFDPALSKVEYSSRYVYCLFYDRNVKLPAYGDTDDIGEFIEGNDTYRYLCIDNVKKSLSGDCPTSVLLHTTVPFGIKYKEETKESVLPILKSSFWKLFPNWPEPNMVKVHKWKYSQVVRPYKTGIEAGFALLEKSPLLIIAGDAFSEHSNVNGAVTSATKSADYIQSNIL